MNNKKEMYNFTRKIIKKLFSYQTTWRYIGVLTSNSTLDNGIVMYMSISIEMESPKLRSNEYAGDTASRNKQLGTVCYPLKAQCHSLSLRYNVGAEFPLSLLFI